MRRSRRILLVGLVCLMVGCLVVGSHLWRRYGDLSVVPPFPSFPAASPYVAWITPPTAREFDLPLLPEGAYGPYVQGVTGPLAVDTRYGVQNPSMGEASNCFRGANRDSVPFDQLYHAGVDLFALDARGKVVWGRVAHAPVHAVADGVVTHTQEAGSDGHVVIVEHLLADGSSVYSVYWHVCQVQVREGQPVARAQLIAAVCGRGANSHLHWEMRTFRDGSALFPTGTAGARGTCNGRVAGVGYTWDDHADRARPDAYGYLDPEAFARSH